MKFTIEMTDEIAIIDGVECRIWNGHEESTGVPVRVYVHRVAVPIKVPQQAFEQAPNPSTELLGRVQEGD